MDLRRLLRDVVRELDREAVTGRTETPSPSPSASEAERVRRARSNELAEARRFLQELDPDSQEGLWFDAVAEGYPSRLEAAVAYVRDVKGRPPRS
ncbi:MAG TPA: hypothetical protein VM925_05850 [Labilithrix sp.]|nr:hypothetical protein [Labilithrix sp.]